MRRPTTSTTSRSLSTGERAEGEVYLTAYNRLRSADGTLTDFVQGLRYLDHYRRDADRWRFERRTVVCDWAQQGPVGLGRVRIR
jgi:hypothetical protein